MQASDKQQVMDRDEDEHLSDAEPIVERSAKKGVLFALCLLMFREYAARTKRTSIPDFFQPIDRVDDEPVSPAESVAHRPAKKAKKPKRMLLFCTSLPTYFSLHPHPTLPTSSALQVV
jgi:hypothetical protein